MQLRQHQDEGTEVAIARLGEHEPEPFEQNLPVGRGRHPSATSLPEISPGSSPSLFTPYPLNYRKVAQAAGPPSLVVMSQWAHRLRELATLDSAGAYSARIAALEVGGTATTHARSPGRSGRVRVVVWLPTAVLLPSVST